MYLTSSSMQVVLLAWRISICLGVEIFRLTMMLKVGWMGELTAFARVLQTLLPVRNLKISAQIKLRKEWLANDWWIRN